MRIIVYTVAALLLLAGAAAAQAPATVLPGNCPASVAAMAGSIRTNTAFRIYWCQPDGQPLDGAKITGLPGGTQQLDNVRADRGPFEDKLVQWSAAVPGQPKGSYTVTVIAQRFSVPGNPVSKLLESPPSPSFAFGVDDEIAAPSAPVRLRLDPGNASPLNYSPTPATRGGLAPPR